jgi:hypothetical protein
MLLLMQKSVVSLRDALVGIRRDVGQVQLCSSVAVNKLTDWVGNVFTACQVCHHSVLNKRYHRRRAHGVCPGLKIWYFACNFLSLFFK